MTLATIGGEPPRWATVMIYARQVAEVVAQTEFVPKPLRGKPDACAAAIMYGDELGIDPMMALQSIDVVEGRPRPSASLARALILAAGHSIVVHEMTGQRCRISGLRAGRPESERLVVEWTLGMAQAAGLTNKTNWRTYPRAMLAARASSDLGNLLFPDVMKGLTWISEAEDSLRQADSWAPEGAAPEPPAVAPPRRRQPPRRALREPGYAIATEEHPGPDGSVDVPLPQADPGELGSRNDAPRRAGGVNEPDPGPAPQAVRYVDVTGLPEVDLPPEVPDPASEPEAPPAPISKGQQKLLQTLLSDVLGTTAGDDERHQVQALILGHPVTTATAHSAHEASRLIDVLGQVAREELDLVLDKGEWRIQSREDSQPPWDPPEPGSTPWDDLGGGS